MFGTLGLAFRLVNTAATAYLCGKIGWEAFKGIRGAQKESLRASELRRRFVNEYISKHGEGPSEDLIQTALSSYDAVERPIRHKIATVASSIRDRMLQKAEDGVDRLERLVKPKPDPNRKPKTTPVLKSSDGE